MFSSLRNLFLCSCERVLKIEAVLAVYCFRYVLVLDSIFSVKMQIQADIAR